MLNNKILFYMQSKNIITYGSFQQNYCAYQSKKKSKTLNLIVQYFVLQNKRFDIDIVFRTQVLHNT